MGIIGGSKKQLEYEGIKAQGLNNAAKKFDLEKLRAAVLADLETYIIPDVPVDMIEED